MINAYRPHQARESVILEMEGRVEGMRGEVERIRKGRRRVEELFQELSGEGGGDEGAVMGDREGTGKGMEKVDGVEGKRRERQRDAWDALGRLR